MEEALENLTTSSFRARSIWVDSDLSPLPEGEVDSKSRERV
jgi:hypothetical protein